MELEEEQGGGGDEGAPAWMATFSDLATLLLTFFVLMLSFANIDVQNFKTALGSVKEAMGVQFKVKGQLESLATSPLELSPVQSGSHISIEGMTHQVAEKVRKYVKKHGLEGSIEVEASPRGVILRARERVLFGVGSDELVTRSGPVLGLIAGLFKGFTGELSIQGHTDSVPIRSSRFPSNWELSAARATAVLRHLHREHGFEVHRMQIAGYADTKPVDPSDTAEARSRNRRVEFVFQFPVEEGKLRPDEAFKKLEE